jgi:hypothetical protein
VASQPAGSVGGRPEASRTAHWPGSPEPAGRAARATPVRA